MNYRLNIILLMCLGLSILDACSPVQNRNVVSSTTELSKQLMQAQPGDTLWLANGEWKDTELVIEGNGIQSAPIVIMAQTPGRVLLTGNSNLKIGGEYLVVSGLHFTNGYTLTSEVISFQINKNKFANNCRVTETVISDYSNTERHESDYWVGMYGKNNRFDHNALVGKGNLGVTMAVRLTSEESQENNHLIDHNYFGPRENLGANGGETLRIGTSHYSLTYSKTQVINNYFDQCDGEHEIVSNKSCGNLYKGNTFFECVGTLTFRHGNENTAESNAFFGNGKWHTGGIRVINKKHKVHNNYGYGLTGHRFRGALVVMNGVPNSPINRYHQVEEAIITNNTFVNCDYVQLCAGSDSERSAAPINSIIANNVFWNQKKNDVFTVYDDISGIVFYDNIISPNIKKIGSGFLSVESELSANTSGLLVPVSLPENVGITADFKSIDKASTGPVWYVKPPVQKTFGFGKTIAVTTSDDLFKVIAQSSSGDIIDLAAGEYLLTKAVPIQHALTVQSTAGALIKFEKSNLFSIENGGKLSLKGLIIDGSEAPDYAGNAIVSTSKYSMNKNYKLFIEDCDFVDMDVNHSFNLLKSYKNTFADSIVIKNSTFKDFSGSILSLDQETEDIGIYNAEFVIINNSSFKNIGGQVVNLRRGGGDESTFGPLLFIDHSTFENIGKNKKNISGLALSIHGVQRTNIQNSIFKDTQPLDIYHTAGDPITEISNISVDNRTALIISDNTAVVKNVFTKPVSLTDNLKLSEGSPLVGAGTDGKNIGLID